jgi:hypothetical protein
MKRWTPVFIVCAVLGAGAATAHETKKMQMPSEALAKLLPAGTKFDAKAFGWEEVAAGALPKVERLKKLSLGEVEAAGGEVHAGFFTVTGDWGPIQAVAALQGGKVLGVEIVTFTEHVGDMITKPAFLKQFQGLPVEGLAAAQLKPLPQEPQAVEALKAGLVGLAKAAEAHEHEHEHEHKP